MTAPVWSRDLPHPWAMCEVCGEAAGVRLPGHADATCSACARREVLREAARTHLAALAGPVLGAWASYWQTVGVPLKALDSVCEDLSGAWLYDVAQPSYRRARLRYLARQHAAPTVTVSPPDRVALDVDALPYLTECRPADPAHGINWPHFLDSHGQTHTIYPGPDTLTLTLPDGLRVLIVTGIHGQTGIGQRATGAPGYCFHAHLWPHVQAALSGEEVTP